MRIEFDPRKAAANLAKHGVRFDEAASCLFDERALVREDALASGESRWVLLGMSERGRLLVVVYALHGDNPRIISARRATTKEVRSYA